MTHYLTIFHNDAILPVCESVLVGANVCDYLGESDIEAGSIRMWNCGELRIVLSNNILTS